MTYLNLTFRLTEPGVLSTRPGTATPVRKVSTCLGKILHPPYRASNQNDQRARRSLTTPRAGGQRRIARSLSTLAAVPTTRPSPSTTDAAPHWVLSRIQYVYRRPARDGRLPLRRVGLDHRLSFAAEGVVNPPVLIPHVRRAPVVAGDGRRERLVGFHNLTALMQRHREDKFRGRAENFRRLPPHRGDRSVELPAPVVGQPLQELKVAEVGGVRAAVGRRDPPGQSDGLPEFVPLEWSEQTRPAR